MSEPKWTPGDWWIDVALSGTIDCGGAPRAIIRSDHGTIAVVSFPDEGDDEANALLMAASKPLCEALTELKVAAAALYDKTPVIRRDLELALLKTNAALAKAGAAGGEG